MGAVRGALFWSVGASFQLTGWTGTANYWVVSPFNALIHKKVMKDNSKLKELGLTKSQLCHYDMNNKRSAALWGVENQVSSLKRCNQYLSGVFHHSWDVDIISASWLRRMVWKKRQPMVKFIGVVSSMKPSEVKFFFVIFTKPPKESN